MSLSNASSTSRMSDLLSSIHLSPSARPSMMRTHFVSSQEHYQEIKFDEAIIIARCKSHLKGDYKIIQDYLLIDVIPKVKLNIELANSLLIDKDIEYQRETLKTLLKTIISNCSSFTKKEVQNIQYYLGVNIAIGIMKPIVLQCQGLINQLDKPIREKEEKKNEILDKQNMAFEDLLSCEVGALIDDKLSKSYKEIFRKIGEYLRGIKCPVPDGCYIVYGWSTPENNEREKWVRDCLRLIKSHLEEAGIPTVHLDVDSNPLGGSIKGYMDKTETDEFVLMVGTKSALDKQKYSSGTAAVCTEVILAKRKQAKDANYGLRRVLPILLTHDIERSFSPEYERFNTVRDWRENGYLENLKELIFTLYGLDKQTYYKSYKEKWEKFEKDSPNYQAMVEFKKESARKRHKIKQGFSTPKPEIDTSPAVELNREHDRVRDPLHRISQISEHLQPKHDVNKVKVDEKREIRWQLPAPINGNGNGHGHENEESDGPYVKRHSIEAQIKDRLSQSSVESAVITVMWGTAGLGKTTTMHYFIHKSSYLIKAWFNNADTPIMLIRQYRDFAEAHHICGNDEIRNFSDNVMVQKIKDFFERQTDWIIVYDNAETYDKLKDYLPHKGGYIFITCRRRPIQPDISFAMEKMSIEEARILIRNITGTRESDNVIDKLVRDKLGLLPLSMSQAGGYIRANEGMSVEEYLGIFDNNYKNLLNDSTMPSGFVEHAPVWVTWDVDMKKLMDVAKEAITFLQACSFLDSVDIPEDLIKKYFEKKKFDDFHYNKARRYLLDYSLIKVNVKAKTLSLHRLIQDITRDKVGGFDQHIFLRLLAEIFLSEFPKDEYEVIAKHASLITHFARLLEHILKYRFNDLVFANALNKAGEIHTRLGARASLKRAKDFYKECLKMRRKLLPASHPDIAETLNNLGFVYRDLQGKKNLQRAITYYEEALKISEDLGKDPLIATSLNGLGLTYYSRGIMRGKKVANHDIMAAIEYQEKALEIRRRLPNAEIDIVKCLNGLGISYMVLKDADSQKKAVKYFEEALEISSGLPKNDVFQKIITLCDLGIVHHDMGGEENIRKAISYLVRARENRRVILKHPGIALTSFYLGSCYIKTGDVSAGITLIKESLAILREETSPEHNFVIFVEDNFPMLKEVLEKRGSFPEVTALLNQIRDFEIWSSSNTGPVGPSRSIKPSGVSAKQAMEYQNTHRDSSFQQTVKSTNSLDRKTLNRIQVTTGHIIGPTALFNRGTACASVKQPYSDPKLSSIVMSPLSEAPVNFKGKEMISHRSITWNLPMFDHMFYVPRVRLESKIEEEIACKPIVVLHGLGGMGKTTLANRISHQSFCRIKIWFNAETEVSLIIQYRDFAVNCGIFTAEMIKNISDAVVIERVKDYLEAQQEEWLIVYDNAISHHQLERYLPSKGGHILITSRTSDWPLENTIAIKEMEINEARCLVRKMTQTQESNEVIDSLVKSKLQLLPLAVAHACGYISANVGMSVEEYEALYNKYEKDLLNTMGIPNGFHQQPVWITWDLDMKKIEGCVEAKALLQTCAFLDGESIPEDFIIKYLNEIGVSESQYRQAISLLHSYFLITVDANKKTLALHKLVQTVTRGHLKEPAGLIKGLIKFFLKELDPDEFQVIIKQSTLINHFDCVLLYAMAHLSDDLILADALSKAGEIHVQLCKRSDLQKATTYYKECLRIRRKLLNPEHIDIANILINFGYLHWELRGEKNLQQAIKYYEEALKISDHFPRSASTQAKCIHGLGLAYFSRGGVENIYKAIALHQKALAIRTEIDDVQRVAQSLNCLGIACWELRGEANIRKAIEYHKRALDLSGRLLVSTNNIETTIALCGLGLAYHDLEGSENITQAVLYLEQAIQKKGRVFNHPGMSLCSFYLGSCLLRQGKNMQPGIDLIKESLAILRNEISPEHQFVVVIRRNFSAIKNILAKDKSRNTKMLLKEMQDFEGWVLASDAISHARDRDQSMMERGESLSLSHVTQEDPAMPSATLTQRFFLNRFLSYDSEETRRNNRPILSAL